MAVSRPHSPESSRVPRFYTRARNLFVFGPEKPPLS